MVVDCETSMLCHSVVIIIIGNV